MTLRDELAELVMSDEARPMGSCSCSECGRGVADAVLASPPLAAVRYVIRGLMEDAIGGDPSLWSPHLAYYGSTPSVVARVLGEEQ